jgi:hypothetical protein
MGFLGKSGELALMGEVSRNLMEGMDRKLLKF